MKFNRPCLLHGLSASSKTLCKPLRGGRRRTSAWVCKERRTEPQKKNEAAEEERNSRRRTMEKNNSAERVPTLAELRRAEMMALHAIETAVDAFVAASALARDAAGVVKEKGAAKCKCKETLQKAIAQPAASEVNPQQMDKKLEIEAVLAAVCEQMRKKECAKKEAVAAKVALLAEKDDDDDVEGNVKLKVHPPTAAKAVAVSEAYMKRIMEGVEAAKEAAAVPRPDESGVMEQDEAEALEEQLPTKILKRRLFAFEAMVMAFASSKVFSSTLILQFHLITPNLCFLL